MSVDLEPKPIKTAHLFQKGQPSRNPKGRPKAMTLTQAARSYTHQAVKRLVYWMEQDKFPAQSLRAIEILLERGHGKAVQPISDGNEHPALNLDLKSMKDSDIMDARRVLQKLLRHSRADILDVLPDGTVVPAGQAALPASVDNLATSVDSSRGQSGQDVDTDEA